MTAATDEPRRDEPADGKCNSPLPNRPGALCRHPAGFRTDHPGLGNCYRHGGSSPNGRKHADRLANEHADAQVAQVAQVAAEFGLWDTDVDHVETVQAELRRCAGMINLCEHHIGKLDPDQLVWGIASISEKTEQGIVTERTVKEQAELNAWVRLWHLERDKALRAAEAAHRIGMEQRQIELAERMGEELSHVLRRFAEFMGIASDPRAGAGFRYALGVAAVPA